MASTLTIDQIHERAQEEVTFNGEKLVIEHAYLWRNSMPLIKIAPENQERVRAAHLVLKIKRCSSTTDGQPMSTPPHPYPLLGIHVIRTSPGVDAQEGTHFTWKPREDLANPTDAEISSAMERGEPILKILIEEGQGTTITVNGWNGPQFSGNAIKYVAVAELAGDVFLKSKPETMNLVS